MIHMDRAHPARHPARTQVVDLADQGGIASVITRLDAIVAHAHAYSSRLGYFAALYRRVTQRVAKALADGVFDDPVAVEALDVCFARRYFDAYDGYVASGKVPAAWQVAFDATHSRRPIVLQHLLLAVNAHINFDLGIATARTVSPDRLPDFHADFLRINEILATLIDEVERELAEIWPMFAAFDRCFGSLDEALIRFSIRATRDLAWEQARNYADLDVALGRPAFEAALDSTVAAASLLIRHPGLKLTLVTGLVRIGEPRDIRSIIRILERPSAQE